MKTEQEKYLDKESSNEVPEEQRPQTQTYRVVWEMDIEAESPREAAERALEIQRDCASIANVFRVYEKDDLEGTLVDLEYG